MNAHKPYTIQTLSSGDADQLRALLDLFGRVFAEPDTFARAQPSESYLEALLGGDQFIAVIATDKSRAIGGIAAYELQKFEQERSEIYIYDLAVDPDYRRIGIATALIERIKSIAGTRHAWVIHVQADKGDEGAIALYTKLGVREDVLHFDIEPA